MWRHNKYSKTLFRHAEDLCAALQRVNNLTLKPSVCLELTADHNPSFWHQRVCPVVVGQSATLHLGQAQTLACLLNHEHSTITRIIGIIRKIIEIHTHTHTQPFNGPFSRTTRVSRYQKGKTNLDFSEARDGEWQWHQLGHMQVCTLLQTDNHASTPPLSFLQAGCPSCCPINSVRALKA